MQKGNYSKQCIDNMALILFLFILGSDKSTEINLVLAKNKILMMVE